MHHGDEVPGTQHWQAGPPPPSGPVEWASGQPPQAPQAPQPQAPQPVQWVPGQPPLPPQPPLQPFGAATPWYPARRRTSPSWRTGLLVVAAVLVVVGCLGGAAYGVLALAGGPAPIAQAPVRNAEPGLTAPAPTTTGSAATTAKARAKSYPAASDADLEKVCDRSFFPKSPAYAGPAPHPMRISVKDRMDLSSRVMKSFHSSPPGGSAAAKLAWEPKDLATVQLVACLDLVEVGPSVRTCHFDTPAPAAVPMSEGIYRLSLYEVATRRLVSEVRLTGDDDDCPTLVLMGATKMVYSEVEDRQLVDALTRFVEQ